MCALTPLLLRLQGGKTVATRLRITVLPPQHPPPLSFAKLTQARGHEDFARWKQALEAYACSIPMGPKILDGDPLLASVLSAQPDTHDIPHDSGGKVAIYSSLSDADKEAANACNNWIVLAQRASNAASKIHYRVFNTVDEPIKDMICLHRGDGRAA